VVEYFFPITYNLRSNIS